MKERKEEERRWDSAKDERRKREEKIKDRRLFGRVEVLRRRR